MLKLTTSEYRKVRGHGEETYPEECCGILLGTFDGDLRIVHSTVRCPNAAPNSRHTSYWIDPRELIRAQREARACGWEIVGFYHSHPDHPPQWSPSDLERAHWIGYSYVITTVENGTATETDSFVLMGTFEEDKEFVNEEVIVDASTA